MIKKIYRNKASVPKPQIWFELHASSLESGVQKEGLIDAKMRHTCCIVQITNKGVNLRRNPTKGIKLKATQRKYQK